MESYTREQALEKSVKYFNGDTLAADVFVKKYALSNGTDFFEQSPDEMHSRLAKEFARIEAKYPNPMKEDEIFSLLSGFRFIVPQGSPMSAIGNELQIQSTSNCFVIPSPKDSYGGILLTDQELVQIAKRRGGIGFDISTIRPKGLKTNNAAKTTDGIGIFMERFSNSTREVAQNGRRGALMLTISVHHPEIRTFVNIKRNLEKVTGANISVRLSDEFMQAVENDQDFELRWPVDAKTPEVSEMCNARELWDDIIENAHAAAEPGLLFWDTAIRMTPSDIYTEEGFGSESTNPCFSGDTLIAVADGRNAVSIKDLAQEGNDVPVYSLNPDTGLIEIKMGRNPRKTGSNKKLLRIHLDDGSYLDTTENHNFITKDGKKVQAKDLSIGESLPRFDADHDCSGENNGRYMGITSEEIKEHAISLTKKLGRKFSNNEWLEYAETNNLPKTFSNMHHKILGNSPSNLATKCAIELGYFSGDPRLFRTLDKALSDGYNAEIIGNKILVQKSCEGCRSAFQTEYHRREISFCSHSCYLDKHNNDANMHKKRTEKTIETYKSIMNDKKIQQAKIWSDLNFSLKRKPKLKEWEQKCKDENISFRLKTKHGFQNWKEVCEAGANYNHKVVKIEELPDLHDVYNITVDDNHTVSVITKEKEDKCGIKSYSGVNVFQCGEIILSPYDSCRLLLINLLSFVDNPFTKNATFNYESYSSVVEKAQRLMDDMIDLEIEKIEKIINKIKSDPEPEHVKAIELSLWNNVLDACKEGRRTGLGVTAVGDTLAALGIRYGSDESIEVVEELYKHLCLASYTSSIKMAEERGSFPICDVEKELGHPFISRVLENLPTSIVKKYKKYGRRNIANTTTAPAGSVSCLTQTTSGIEPAYLLEYTRRRKLMHNEDLDPDFVDHVGDRWVEYKVYHHGYQKWMEITGESDPSKSPYHKATANEINWVNKVKMQAAAQKWVCHAISNTTNIPEETSVETVKDIYMTGWKSGCKGVTVYRNNSRSGVLVSKKDKKKKYEIITEDGESKILTEDDMVEYNGESKKLSEIIRNHLL